MYIGDKKVAILVDNYFEQAELDEPLMALRDSGAEVDIISANEKILTGLNHVDKADKFKADLLLKDANPDDYDALVLPGGPINANALRMNEEAQQMVIDFLNSDRPVAAICHAPLILVSADVVDGRRLTSNEAIQDDISNAGGKWLDKAVVVDNNLITSRKPDDLPMFNEALIRMLSKKHPAESMVGV